MKSHTKVHATDVDGRSRKMSRYITPEERAIRKAMNAKKKKSREADAEALGAMLTFIGFPAMMCVIGVMMGA